MAPASAPVGQGYTRESALSFPSEAGVAGLVTVPHVGGGTEAWVLQLRIRCSVTWFLFPRS